jgi:hypothetical protein
MQQLLYFNQMKTSLTFTLLLFSAAIIISCGSGKSKEANTEGSSMPIPKSNTANAQDTSTQTSFILKWKDVYFMEHGPTFLFEDRTGKEFSFNYLEVPGFDLDNNGFFTTVRYEDRVFPELKLKVEIKDQWFRITIEKQMRDIEGLGETGEVDVITGIEPVE